MRYFFDFTASVFLETSAREIKILEWDEIFAIFPIEIALHTISSKVSKLRMWILAGNSFHALKLFYYFYIIFDGCVNKYLVYLCHVSFWVWPACCAKKLPLRVFLRPSPAALKHSLNVAVGVVNFLPHKTPGPLHWKIVCHPFPCSWWRSSRAEGIENDLSRSPCSQSYPTSDLKRKALR